LVSVGGALVMACHGAPPPPPFPPVVTVVVDTATRPPTRRVRSDTALSAAERDALVREAQTRRAAWRALGITDYRLRVAVGCFCPWRDTPAVVEVRGGVAVGLRDTSGRGFGKLREPWSLYTVETLFDAVEQGARRNDLFEVTYDPRYGYPTYMHGDARLGLPDDWFWVRATELTPRH
jgi:hypothetical protein